MVWPQSARANRRARVVVVVARGADARNWMMALERVVEISSRVFARLSTDTMRVMRAMGV